jgi:hypothetical protein
MTKLLGKAFAEADKLPKKQQDELAKWVLAEIEAEQRWSEAFRKSAARLSELASQALEEHHKGKSRPLDLRAL